MLLRQSIKLLWSMDENSRICPALAQTKVTYPYFPKSECAKDRNLPSVQLYILVCVTLAVGVVYKRCESSRLKACQCI